MSGPVTGREVRAAQLHASTENLAIGEQVEAEIPPPTATEGFLPCAHWWVDAGFFVFPLYPANEPVREGDSSDPGKKPNGRLLGSGNDVDTIGTDEHEQVRLWWRKEPSSGVAINATRSRVLIIDIDPRNGGWQYFLPWCERNGVDLSEVPRSASPRGDGGVHLFWALPTGTSYTFGRFMTGVDRPWQVPVPPSPRWVQTGEDRKGSAIYGWANYTWLAGDPRVLPMAPEVLLSEPLGTPRLHNPGEDTAFSATEFDGTFDESDDVLMTTEYGSIDHSRLGSYPIPIGDQNKAFKRIACSMIRFHIGDAEIINRLLELAAISPVGDPRNPWTRADMERITRHARRFVENERNKEIESAAAMRAAGLTKMDIMRRSIGIS